MNVIHYCPYCGDEDLWPLAGHGHWRCKACTRAFAIRSLKPQELS